MTDERKGGIALIAAQAALMTTMGLHLHPGEDVKATAMAAHALAILTSPITLYGAAILSLRLKTRLAFSYQLCALVVGMLAPIISGFVATQHPAPEVMKVAWILNQTCSRIWVGGSAIAFALWGIASWRERLLPRSLAVYGFVCAVVVLAAVFTGIPLDAHHATMLAALGAIFYVWAGVVLIREESALLSVRAT